MRFAFWGVFAAGFAACTVFGIGPVLKRLGVAWISFPMIVGSVLGVVIMALALAFVTGQRPALLADDARMLCALAGLIGVKVVVGLMTTTGVFTRA